MTESLELTPTILAVLGILALTLFLFVSEIVRVDVAAIAIMVLLGVSGLVGANDTFSGFASNAVVSIIAVMILGAGLDKTGAMNQIARPIIRLAGNTESRLIAFIAGAVGIISSFMQNIGAAALFLPAVKRISTRTAIPLSRLLMPMGFCAILGGTVTLVGSSPLILLNDLVTTANRALPEGASPIPVFELFEVTPIGLILIATGILYFVLLGKRILPATSGAEADLQSTMEYLARHYNLEGQLFEVTVPPESTLAGGNIDFVRAQSGYRISVVALARDRAITLAPVRDTVVQPGDVLGMFGHREHVARFAETFKLDVSSSLQRFDEVLSPGQSGLSEVVIAPRSSLTGKTMREIKFRLKYQATILALHRGGAVITEKLSDVPFQPGDTLLLHSSWESLALLDQDRDFIVITDYPQQDLGMRPDKLKYAAVFFLVSIGLVLFTDLRLSTAFMTGAIGMILTGVLRIDEAYQSIDWRTVFLLAGLIPLGIAVEQSGTAAWIAHNILMLLGEVPQWVLLTVVVVLATAFSLVMSNVGATVLLVPLAIKIALGAGFDPRLFALAVGLATSNSFILPTHQVNALIMGAGGYRNRDFLRAGGIMTLIFIVVVVTMLSLFY
ncbi:potassium transporter TrkA [Sulfurifustis variabilis]|uniref:Potassium transporter TrkA n=1 Tax=Sulfurifustis variabilis TaxID=1675686 RepID=A0A1B4V7P7_9GAMM|nr:SLC13 family permease [Sulfurifustis variabilis]BAU48642.1 potassium transporter TrkA [Sulfurifustis variabilis]